MICSEIQLILFVRVSGLSKAHIFCLNTNHKSAEIAQLGERQTEDLKIPGSIPGFGNMFIFFHDAQSFVIQVLRQLVGQETQKTNTSDALLYYYFEKLFDFLRIKR